MSTGNEVFLIFCTMMYHVPWFCSWVVPKIFNTLHSVCIGNLYYDEAEDYEAPGSNPGQED
jgi:hypothetical protein